DIAAARAFLDERNDAGECNTNSVIVIGAGDGAALGALWMHSEMSRRRQKDPNSLALRPPLAEPEGRDLAAAVWLTIHPKIGSRAISNLLARYLLDVGGTHKVPMAFVYGKQDTSAANLARYYKTQLPLKAKGAKLENTGEKAFDTKLGGSALLQR